MRTDPEPRVDVSESDPSAAGLPVVVGCPFPRGQVPDPAALRLEDPGGAPRPLAARCLVSWPDGSVRWGLLAFGARHKGPHRVHTDGDPCDPVDAPVRIEQNAALTTLDNGLVQVHVSHEGPGPVQQIIAGERQVIKDPADFQFRVDDASSLHQARRQIRVLESSVLRARVRIEGEHATRDGTRRLHYRCDVELWMGWPSVRFDYQFFHMEPGCDPLDIQSISMELDVQGGRDTERHFVQREHGLFYRPREVRNPDKVAIVADDGRFRAHVEEPSMLLDEVQYPSYLRPPLVNTSPWLGVLGKDQGNACGVYLSMQDLEEMRPKRLVSEGTRLGLEVWPRGAGTLRLPQGRSRRQVVTLAMTDRNDQAPPWIHSALAAPVGEGRACVDPAWVARCGEFHMDRMLPRGTNVRFEKYLRRLVGIQTPALMFDLGDTPDSGYSRTYIPLGLDAVPPRPGAPDLPRVFGAGPHGVVPEWALPQLYEPVWTNNEYDLIHALCVELMRTGRHDLWPTLRRVVRHTVEVDFVHFSDHQWIHRATPTHCVGHTKNGAYPSHFWTQGLLEYYCLVGDPDALEVAEALGDKIRENFEDPELRKVQWGFSRELGWAALSLALLVDITGEERFKDQLKNVVEFFVSFDRRGAIEAVNLSGVDPRRSLECQMIGSFFGFASMVEGVDEYARLSGRQDVVDWLVALLYDLREALDQADREGLSIGARSMVPQALAIAHERTGDEDFLRAGMTGIEELIESPAWGSPPAEVKPVAMLHRGLVRFLGHAQRLGMLEDLEYLRYRKGTA